MDNFVNMTCSNCQRTLKDDVTFCSHCGQVVVREVILDVAAEAADAVEESATQVKTDAGGAETVDLEFEKKSEPEEETDSGGKPEGEPQSVADEDFESVPNRAQISGQPKSFKTVWLISVFGGWLGLDRFYLGHVGTGVLKLLGAGWYGIWWSVDMTRLLRGRQADKNGVLVEDRENFRPVAVVISTVLFTLIGLCWLILLLAAMTPSSSD